MNDVLAVENSQTAVALRATADPLQKNGWAPGGSLCASGSREFPFHDVLVRLGEASLRNDTQPSRVTEKLIDALVRNLSVQQFAHARLRPFVNTSTRIFQDRLL